MVACLVLRRLQAAVGPWSRWCSSACRCRTSRCFSASCHALKPLAVVRVRPNCYAVCACEAPSPSLSRSGTYMFTNLSRVCGPVKMDLAPSASIVCRAFAHEIFVAAIVSLKSSSNAFMSSSIRRGIRHKQWPRLETGTRSVCQKGHAYQLVRHRAQAPL